MEEIESKIIKFLQKDDLKESINDLNEIIILMEKKKLDTSIIGLIANIIASNEEFDKELIIDAIKDVSGDLIRIYENIRNLPLEHTPKVDPKVFFEED